MSRFITAQSSFRAGRMSEKMFGRVDVREYGEGLSVAKNAFIAKQGGAYKRFGSQSYMALNSDTGSRNIITLNGLDGDSFTIVFYPSYFQIRDAEGYYIGAGNYAVLPTGNLDTSLFSAVSYENKIYIAHYSGSIPPIEITITDGQTISIEYFDQDITQFSFPFEDPNTDGTKQVRLVNVDQPTTNLVLEANHNLFTADMVGESVRVVGLAYYPTIETAIAGNVTVQQTDIFRIIAYTSPTQVRVEPTKLIKLNNRPNAGDPVQLDDFCVFVTADLDKVIANESEWITEFNLQSWSTRNGWPKTVAVDEGRLVFGGTPTKPMTFYGSAVGDPRFFLDKRYVESSNVPPTFSYSGDIVDTDPYQFTISSKKANRITFMETALNFVIGTDRQEFIISGSGATISKKNVSVRPHTAHGSAPLLSESSDNVVFYVGKTREQLFLFKYNEANGSYITQEVSILNDDLFGEKIKRMTWHEELGLLMLVTDSNKLITLTYNTETGTLALAEHEFNYPIIDVAYSSGRSEDDFGILLSQKDGRYFLEALDRIDILDGVTSVLENENLGQKIIHSDSVQNLPNIIEYYPKYADSFFDVVLVNEAEFILGQEFTFSSTNPNALDTSGLSLGVTYYAIPFKNTTFSGIRVATSPANAAANIYVDITAPDLFKMVDVTLTTSRTGSTIIPIKNYQVGDEITIYHDQGGVPNSLTHTKLLGEDELDIGAATLSSVLSGVAFKMEIATMPLEAGGQWGTAQLGLKRIDNLLVRFYETYSFKVSSDGYNEEEVVYNEITNGKKVLAFTASSELDQRVFITNDKIEPCYISNLSMRGVSNDG